MDISRSFSTKGRKIVLRVEATLTDQERAIVSKFGLWDYRIKTRDGPFAGRNAISLNMKSAYRTQISKVKNRWGASLTRTTGVVLVDAICLMLSGMALLVRGIFKMVFGQRRRLSDATNGIVIKSTKVERIREAEFFIFISLAAVSKAIAYAEDLDSPARVFHGKELFSELEGLDFAGAGTAVEDDFAEIRTLAGELAPAH